MGPFIVAVVGCVWIVASLVQVDNEQIAGYQEFRRGDACVHATCELLEKRSSDTDGEDYQQLVDEVPALIQQAEATRGREVNIGIGFLTALMAAIGVGGAVVAKSSNDTTGLEAGIWSTSLALLAAGGIIWLTLL